MDKSPESQIGWRRDRIKDHQKGFVAPGVAAIAFGLVMPHIGYFETSNTLLGATEAIFEYSVAMLGAGAVALGFYEIGILEGEINEIKKQSQLDQA